VIILFSKINIFLLVLILLQHGNVSYADISLNGYASIVAGRVTTGTEFLADYPKAGVYDNDWSFSPDTTVGVQLIANLNDNLEFVIQGISNGAADYDVDVDWAYINYQVNNEFSAQVGRKRLPLYYYSDFFDVGYAYYWIRPPVDNYTWQISHYNGLSLQYQPYLGEWDILVNLYAGREDSEDNELLGFLSSASIDETWKNMAGIVTELSKDWFEFRATYMQGQLDRTVNDIVTDEDVKQKFSGISLNFYIDDFLILSEINQYIRSDSDIHVDTHMLSLGYQWKLGNYTYTPHITQSSLQQKENLSGGDEEHTTNSIGLRWDYNKSTALKIQYDKTKDRGVTIPVLGDSETLSLGLDIVF